MASVSPTAAAPSPCPECDAPLAAELATVPRPECPSCGARLLPLEVAGFGRRLAAGLVDLAIVGTVGGALTWGLLWALGIAPLFPHARGLDLLFQALAASPLDLVSRAIPGLLVGGLYFWLFWTLLGRTPGETWLGLEVVREDGEAPGPLRSAIRVLALVPSLLVGGLGIWWIAFDPERRAFHDHAAGTFVPRAR